MGIRGKTVAAVDMGASGGRVVTGAFDGGQLHAREVHRFENKPVNILGTQYWDILRIYSEILEGLRKAVSLSGEAGGKIFSAGIDSWGVDFGLLDDRGRLLENPVSYRDSRTDGVMETICEKLGREKIFQLTGIQFLQLNTIYQLAAIRGKRPELLERAATLLALPDLLGYFLTGVEHAEFTMATTTQLFDSTAGDWAWELVDGIDAPRRLFRPVSQPGVKVADLLMDAVNYIGAGFPIVSIASHDTASAVAAVPAVEGKPFAFLSCGTWSLLGTEVERPVITKEALEWNFTNEGGAGSTFRLLKNIMGLWLLQETRREWRRSGRKVSWEEMDAMAKAASGKPAALIDPDAPEFLHPGDMSGRIRDFLRTRGLPAPESDGESVRSILVSLACKYRWALDRTETLSGKKFDVLHAVGGGIRNRLLMQMTADMLERPVIAGPVEASSLGNIVLQMIASGQLAGITEARRVIDASFPTSVYEPSRRDWARETYGKYIELYGAA